ncbi:epimerase [Ensifer sp. Root31]|uniref:SDR family oxidoreductase n=1 Tax=Ensifer sp. Root31 TaxID=1736512 RepID=UPI00070EA200|nr:SDR family oxidoreductase [Ensifer sp. Root31]KQU86353.1 epimerase [Ensifer sp. Root31]
MSATKGTRRHIVVFGGYGVIGTGVVAHLLGRPHWNVTTVGRSSAPGMLFDGKPAPAHVQVDLLDATTTVSALVSMSDVTDVVFCAYIERETMAAAVAPNVTILGNALEGLRAAGARPGHVVLIGGGKSYGEHLGAYKTPAKERDARFMGPIFYNDQEDLLWERAGNDGFNWTVLRPDAMLGPSIGSPMNMLMGIAAYASVSKELGIPLRFPGSLGAWSALHQATDAGVLAEAVEWALTSQAARGEIFNVTNGDNFRWQHVWPEIASVFDMDVASPQPMQLAEQMADKGDLWQEMILRHGLRSISWERLAAWAFVDGWFNMDADMVQSTIKIRQAGFNGCADTHNALIAALKRLRQQKIVP